MTQGSRITGNLFYDNETDEDLFLEVNHGPYLVDNNSFLSRNSIRDLSEGGAFLYNYVAGQIYTSGEHRRQTPWQEADSTAIAGITATAGGDNHFYGNTFVGRDILAGDNPREERHHGLTWRVGSAILLSRRHSKRYHFSVSTIGSLSVTEI